MRGEGSGETCALDLAAWGGMSFTEIGFVLGVSKQRAEQIERVALRRMRGRLQLLGVTRADIVHAVGWFEADGGEDAA
ncbi:MAG: hypothetical protein HY898_35130 [Deltaproteobacteria bacterium]|nr:hypothetical protein [Deltaproteobacteria bacterium]